MKMKKAPVVKFQSTFKGQKMVLYTDRSKITRYGRPKVIQNGNDGVFVGFYKNKKLTRVYNIDNL